MKTKGSSLRPHSSISGKKVTTDFSGDPITSNGGAVWIQRSGRPCANDAGGGGGSNFRDFLTHRSGENRDFPKFPAKPKPTGKNVPMCP